MVSSVLAAIFVGIVVAFGTRTPEHTVIATLVTFIVSIVVVATLDLSVKPEDQDPNKPRLR